MKAPAVADLALYTVAEVADLWRVHRATVYRLIADGELATVNIGQGRAKTRITARALADYIERKAAA